MSATADRVAVFGLDSAPALACIQSLGRRGIAVDAYGHTPLAAARWSRHVTRYRHCPAIADRAKFLPWLKQELQAGRIHRIAPTSDLMAWYCSELRELFAPAVQRSIPPLSAVAACLDKGQFAQACDALGMPTPRSFTPESLDQALDAAKILGYPLMLKPRTHIGVGTGPRGGIVRDEAALRQWFQPYSIRPGYEDVLAQHPGFRWPLLQEFMPSARLAVYHVTGFRDPDTGICLSLSSLRTQSFPPDVGISAAQEVHEKPDLRAQTHKLVDHLLPAGIFELELLEREGRYYAIDLNPRAYGFISLNIAVGHDLPWLWYRSTFEPVQALAAAPVLSGSWRYGLPFYVRHLAWLILGPGRVEALRSLYHAMTSSAASITGGWSDPLPKLFDVVHVLRHPLGLLRPIIAEQWRLARLAQKST